MAYHQRIEYDTAYLVDRFIISDGNGKRVGVNDRGYLVWVGADQPQEDYPWPRCADEEILRALYEALAQHFGGTGHDTRALRSDYEHEKRRVDRMIDHLLARPTVIAQGAQAYPPVPGADF